MRPLLLLTCLLCATPVHAQKMLPEAASATVRASDSNPCTPGMAQSELSANDVRAALFNSGNLFWRGGASLYNVPASSSGQPHPLFDLVPWIGGQVAGEIRLANVGHGFGLSPGPLDAQGNPPPDCALYDRIWTVRLNDIRQYDETGIVAPDLAAWPYQLGAPVVDGDGDSTNYNLEGGDRPEVLGHETHWWVMNDAGELLNRETPPIRLSVRATAFAADSDDDALAQTTLYRFQLTYRGAQPLVDAYFGLHTLSDLGAHPDDYIGSDTTLDMSYFYAGDDFDEDNQWYQGYGADPPALGLTYLEGLDPHANREMSVLLSYTGSSGPYGRPFLPVHYYNYLRGVWQDGKPILACGNGYNPTWASCYETADTTTFMYPGDPVTGAFWSERNAEELNPVNHPSNRYHLSSTGPFTMQPDETKEVVFAIVYARGANHLDSVTELRKAAQTVRETWRVTGFRNLPTLTAPSAPVQLASPADGAADQPARVSFVWKPAEHARTYDLDLRFDDGETARDTVLSIIGETDLTLVLDSLAPVEPGLEVTWRVRGRNGSGAAPWSETRTFTLSGERLVGQKYLITRFMTVANGAGPLDPPHMGTFAFNSNGFPTLDGAEPHCSDPNVQATCNDRPTPEQQAGPGIWGIHAGGAATFASYMERSILSRAGNMDGEGLGPYDYEWRFVGESQAYKAFDAETTITVPFEIWNIGIGTPDDPSDDFRLIPLLCETCSDGTDGVFDIGGDHQVSGGANDPMSDWVYWYAPADESPGTAGYDKWVAAGANYNAELGREVLARQVIVGFNLGTEAPYEQALPEQGTIFRIVTSKIVLTPPVVSAPGQGAVLEKTATWLYWQEPPETPARRIVQLARDAAFSDVVRADTVTTAGMHAVSALVPGQTYHWRVQFGYAGGTLSPWSEASSFTVSPTATGVEADGERPQVLTLGTVAPNPVRGQARLRFGLPGAAPVRIALYDVLGREVLRVREGEEAPAGWHEARFDASVLASGVYFVRLESGGRQQVRAVVVVR